MGRLAFSLLPFHLSFSIRWCWYCFTRLVHRDRESEREKKVHIFFYICMTASEWTRPWAVAVYQKPNAIPFILRYTQNFIRIYSICLVYIEHRDIISFHYIYSYYMHALNVQHDNISAYSSAKWEKESIRVRDQILYQTMHSVRLCHHHHHCQFVCVCVGHACIRCCYGARV